MKYTDKLTNSNHCAKAKTGRLNPLSKMLIMSIITAKRRIIIEKRAAKMDNAKALSMVSRRAVLVLRELAQKEDAEEDPFAAAHEPQVSTRFAKRLNMFSVSFL